MRLSILFFMFVLCVTFLSPRLHDVVSAAGEKDKDIVVAEVGGEKITMADLNAKVEEIPSYARKNFLSADGKQKILDNLVKSKLLYKAAIDAGYAKDPEIKAKVDDAVQRIYQSEYFKREIKDQVGVTDKELKDYYEKHKEDYKLENRIKVAHIQINTEEEAQNIAKQLKAGDKFEDLAKRLSLDNTTNNTGGVIGYITKGAAIRGIGKSDEFENAAFALKNVGDVSAPVKSPKGWHIIKLTEKGGEGYRTFDEVKNDISNVLLVNDKAIKDEYEKNKSEYMNKARVKVKHIQLNTEAEAQDVLKQLKSGKDFDQLAAQLSQDKSSSNKGGDLGVIYKDGYIRGIGKDPDFEAAAFNAELNKPTEPVKTKKGYHILLVSEKTPEKAKDLAEVEPQIRNKLLRDAKENAVDKQFESLRKKYNVQSFNDKILPSNEGDFKDKVEGGGEEPPAGPQF